MTTAAHTPGPWIYAYSPYTSQDGKEIPAFEVHGEEKVCDTNENRPGEEQEANARLIATAPELLEALTLAQTALNTAQRFHVPGLPRALNDSYKIAAVIDKAIAKATGK